MDKDLLKATFREYKKAAGLAYAITNPNNLGMDMGDVNDSLCDKYGEESKGIFVTLWQKGYNASRPIEKVNSVKIAHDITKEQAEKFYEVFGKHYNITPSAYDSGVRFTLYEKHNAVFELTFTMSREWSFWDKEETRHEIIVGRKNLVKRLNQHTESLLDDDCGIKSLSVKQIF